MTVLEFYSSLSRLYPESLSCPWDNDGIMCCRDTSAEVRRVLVTLDTTGEAVDYAVENSFDLILTHHPLIFGGMKSIVGGRAADGNIIRLLDKGITVISLHTRLDAGEGGVNDAFASALALTGATPFGDAEAPTLGRIGCTEISEQKAFGEMLKKALGGAPVCGYGSGKIRRVAVVGGSGKDFIDAALIAGADTFVTGECSYNTALDACARGLNIFTAGHYHTEFPVCEKLRQLTEELNGAYAEILPLSYPIVY